MPVVVIVVFLLGQPWLTLGIADRGRPRGAWRSSGSCAAAGFAGEPLLGVVIALVVAVLAAGLRSDAIGDDLDRWSALGVVIAAIDAFRRPDARDGFLVWLGTVFGALYVALLAFLLASSSSTRRACPPSAPLAGVAGRRPGLAAGAAC